MDLGLRWEVAPSNRRAPLGPPGPAKYVGFNETNCLTIQYKTRYYYTFIISFGFLLRVSLKLKNGTAVTLSLVRFYCNQSAPEC